MNHDFHQSVLELRVDSSDDAIMKCWDAVFALRPHLKQHDFVALIRSMLHEGYRLAYIEETNRVAAVVGFRYQQFLHNGKHFYIDDLSTIPEARGKGLGTALLAYVFNLAKEQGFETVTLDSGFHRIDAHRLYLNNGFKISSLHFVKMI